MNSEDNSVLRSYGAILNVIVISIIIANTSLYNSHANAAHNSF